MPTTPHQAPAMENFELAHPLQRISSSTNDKKNSMRVLAVEVSKRVVGRIGMRGGKKEVLNERLNRFIGQSNQHEDSQEIPRAHGDCSNLR